GMRPTLALVEAGSGLAVAGGQKGEPGFVDADGIQYLDDVCASWTSGLIGAGNAGSNYFELECSSLGMCDLVLRFDIRSTADLGPTGLTLEYAAGEEAFQTLETLTITRDDTWHAYTNLLGIAALENAERIRIRGTWSADSTGGSSRIDNLQLSGAFTNGLNRVALYTFTGSSRSATLSDEGFVSASLAAINSGTYSFPVSSSNTFSGVPMLATEPLGTGLRDNYFRFVITPTNRFALMPTHIRVYARTGSGTGVLETVALVHGEEYSFGTAEISSTVWSYAFHVPAALRDNIAVAMEFRIYFTTEAQSTMRVDDVEVIGFTGLYPANPVVALFPFTGNAETNTAGNPRVSVSSITSEGTGTVAYYTLTNNFVGSDSGVPALAVDVLNGTAQDLYIAFDLTPRWDTSLKPKLVSLYARTGSGTGTIFATFYAGGVNIPLGTYGIDNVVRPYCFSVPQDLVPSIERGTAQVRLYAWGLSIAASTLRVDDWSVEGIWSDLPPLGTFISVQ
ncbi:MAG: hypothetical protein PHU80_11235, partial [Kiritimatiellae bacterium]|nr:hypothetical protein [Kiritimatiellia bacterium]